MAVYIEPTFRRDGVVAGFILRRAYTTVTSTVTRDGVGPEGEPVVEEVEVETIAPSLTPAIGKGVLFAQGLMYRPVSAPALPAMSASVRRNLYYNSIGGWYWATAAAAADDAFVGWAETNGAGVIAVSVRRLGTGADETVGLPGSPVVAADTTAPNVTAAVPSFTPSQVGGRATLTPSAVVTMPVAHANYQRIKKLHIKIFAPDTSFAGVTEVHTEAAPFAVDGSNNLTVTLPRILQDTKAHTYDWSFSVENEAGEVTPGAFTVSDVAAAAAAGPDVPPANVASITGGEAAGTRYPEDGTRLLRAKFDATVTLTADQGAQTWMLWLSKDNGAYWQGINWYPASGTTGTARIDQAIPVTNETWKFAAKQGRVPFDASVLIADADLPAGAIRQTVGFTVNGLALPASNAITDCVVPAGTGPVGSPYNTVSQDGYFQWAHIPYVSYTDPTDPNGFFVRFTEQDLDASHTPIGPEKPGVGYLVSGGAKKTDPLDADYISPGDGGAATKYVRRKCYVCNRVNQGLYSFQDGACAALQTTAWSGAAYLDVFIGTPPAGSVPGSSVSGAVALATTANSANVATLANTASIANQVPGSGIIGTITLGGGGTVTTVAETKDAGGTRVAWFGKVGSDYGIWARNAWFGGTGPSDPRIWLDTGGAGHFKGAIESGSTITGTSFVGGSLSILTANGTVAISNSSAGVVVTDSFGRTGQYFGAGAAWTNGSLSTSVAAAGVYISGGGTYGIGSFSTVINAAGQFVGGGVACPGYTVQGAQLAVGFGGTVVVDSTARFVGLGVYCPSYSVTCSGLVVAGFTGATQDLTFTYLDQFGGSQFVRINGAAVRTSFKGGAFVGLI